MPCGWEGNRRSYVVIVTASGFNIVAMVCCEAYAFSERSGSRHHAVATVGVTSVRHWRQRHHVTTVGVTSVGRWGRRHHVITVGVTSSNTGGSIGCAIFGVLMVYIGSVIVHLGPTIILLYIYYYLFIIKYIHILPAHHRASRTDHHWRRLQL